MKGLMQDFPLTLHHILWRMERLFGAKEIVTWQPGACHRYTFAEFTVRLRRLARALQRLGVGPGDRVATLAWNGYRHVELYYGVPCMGAVVHTLNLRLTADHLEYIMRDAGDQVLVVDVSLLPIVRQLEGRMPSVQHVVVMDEPGSPVPAGMLDYEALLAAESDTFDWPTVDERSAAAMCYTSGTTENPKGVVYSHRSNFLHTMGLLQVDSVGMRESDTVLPVVPMFHANCWGMPYACGMAGARMVLPHRQMGDAPTVLKLAADERATVMAGVPTIWMSAVELLEKSGQVLSDVRSVLCGGSAIPRRLMERMDRVGLRLVHAWGMTETSPMGTLANPRSWHVGEDEFKVRLSQGMPSPGVELRIAHPETGVALPWDGVAFGELEVRGPWVAAGYHNDADAGRVTADGWFRTGDVASISPDGCVSIVDRTKDVIKSGGEWISSVELENAIMAHPKVLEAAVVGLPHPRWMERP
ncbi:MAG TPA: long-chain fatty acid--CoA ligase, partial [Candidatus Xenobia bacterium]